MHRLRVAREDAGISQRELARRAGVTRALVGSIEQGRHVPAVDAALRLARALGTTAEALFGAEPHVEAHLATGGHAADGTVVRAATVGDQVVVAPLPPDEDPGTWATADGTIAAGALELFPEGTTEGALILGCDPALRAADALGGGRVGGARRAAWTSAAAITYEPAAELYGLNFEPLEAHVVELWAREEFSAHPGVTELLEVIGSRAFRDRVGAHSGYDLSESGSRRAA